jgi:hypothetical protein
MQVHVAIAVRRLATVAMFMAARRFQRSGLASLASEIRYEKNTILPQSLSNNFIMDQFGGGKRV